VTAQRRRTTFAAVLVACLVGAAIAVWLGISSQEPRVASSANARQVLADAKASGRKMVLFRSLEPRGQLAVAPAGGGKPVYEQMTCDRTYFAGGGGLCVAARKGLPGAYGVKVFGPDFRVRHELDVEGIPSRARVSPDGRYGTVTMFVTGHSYAAAGSFSTGTTLIDMARGEKIADLEDFTVTRGDRQITAADMNFWGVTFARDSDRFYATLATGGKTYLIEGSVSRKVARVIHENVECPSLSPDGKRIAYKHLTGDKERPWRLSVLDLSTMRETRLAETRSVDDQAEWLDDGRVLYGVDGAVYAVPADGRGSPQRYLASADSPSAVRW
jgi:hypothetical protein